MPHLSPMNWIMALILFWMSLMLVTSKSWWLNLMSMPFTTPNQKSTNKSQSHWKWSW